MTHYDIGVENNKNMNNVRELFNKREIKAECNEKSDKTCSLDNVFDENGNHILGPMRITTKCKIDFFDETVKFYIVFPRKKQEEQKSNLEEVNRNELIKTKKNKVILYKQFKISKDFNSVTIDDFKYEIPYFFSREQLKINDEKTWQIIFYLIFNDEITSIWSVYKDLARKTKEENADN